MRVVNDAAANNGYCQPLALPAIGLQTIEPRTLGPRAIWTQAMGIANNSVTHIGVAEDVLDHQD